MFDKQSMEVLVLQALTDQICAAAEPIIEQAKEQLERSIREQLAKVVLSMQKSYRVETRGEELIITVENTTN